MINYSPDIGLDKIQPALIHLSRCVTKHTYYVYGMRQNNRPLIRLLGATAKNITLLKNLKNFLIASLGEGLGTQLTKDTIDVFDDYVNENIPCPQCKESETYCACYNVSREQIRGKDNAHYYLIQIGLRRDLRDNPKYAAALIKTIILFCEGKLGGQEFAIPKFLVPKTTKLPKNKKSKTPVMKFKKIINPGNTAGDINSPNWNIIYEPGNLVINNPITTAAQEIF